MYSFKSILILFVVGSSLSDNFFWRNRNCGQRRNNMRETRIIGGSSTFFGEVPWQALIQVKVVGAVLQCGAVLIDHNWLLTAAHCVDNTIGHIREIQVLLGKHCLKEFKGLNALRTLFEDRIDHKNNDWDYSFVTRNAIKVVINEQFNRKTLDNDIAMIRLNQSITPDHNIAPICLPKLNEDFCHQTGYISGFGIIDYDLKRPPHVLQIASVPILPKDYCNYLFERLGHKNVMGESKLCAGVIDGGRDACTGDSGGPLAVSRGTDNKWVLAGIISNGIKCGQPYIPGVYTEVSKFVDWIELVINSDTD